MGIHNTYSTQKNRCKEIVVLMIYIDNTVGSDAYLLLELFHH